ncbi:MAG: polyprenyl synthetase family protein [Bacteroidaceae bacterium]|nr:polyprenyl synthetase family protein [Bacteroidaceae bacterium]
MDETKIIYDVPATLVERMELRSVIAQRVGSLQVQPPLSMHDLSDIALQLMEEKQLPSSFKGWMMVEIHNQVWKAFVASIPYERRLLLLPKCLSHSTKCEAEMDEFGLLCHRCGRCVIPSLEQKAEELGVMSMVAEGFTSVVELIKNRVVDCVIGVSCLKSLEKAFPLLISHAVPGMAIPLNFDGCKDTKVDSGYVMQLLSMRSEDDAYLLDYDQLKQEVQDWFAPSSLRQYLPSDGRQTLEVALQWMGNDGKRWRPYLLTATYKALSGRTEVPEDVKRAAIGVECFHKASLVHDDIQDNDDSRYGMPTLHVRYGVPMAINVGDALLGEGYSLLSQCSSPALLAAVAKAHVELCQGQGIELEWSNHPQSITLDFALDIFRKKTVPAFEVSLQLGAISAGDDASLRQTIHEFSDALGIAYQLQDDVEDFAGQEKLELRPSAILGVLCEENPPSFIEELLQSDDVIAFLNQPIHKPKLDLALERVNALVEVYHQEAIGVLYQLKNVELKRLLFRVTERILNKNK